MNTKRAVIATFLAIGLVSWATSASAQNAVGIGGRTSITANFAVVSSRPDGAGDSDTVVLGANAAYTTESARFEFGGGIQILGFFLDSTEVGIYTLAGEGRINTDALGPDENVLLYAGAVMGLTIIDSDFGDDELFVIGPKIGAELYVTPNVAVQLQDALVVNSDGGIANQLTVGFKFVFQ